MKLFLMILLCGFALASTSAYKSITASGLVTDLSTDGTKIYAGTTVGVVDIFDKKTYKKLKSIKFPKITNFMGESLSPKIFSVNALDSDVLTVCEDKEGYRSLFKNDKKILDSEAHLFIKKASFITKDKVLLGLLSNEMILLDLNTKKIFYTNQINTSTFSDFALSEDKRFAFIGDESGKITAINTLNGKVVATFSGLNVDNIYQIDYKNSIILGCGQDRRLSIYGIKTKTKYYLKGSFLIYSGALSPSGKTGAFAFDKNNNLKVFDVASKKEIAVLTGSKANLTRTIFLSENEIIASSEDKKINIWRIK